MYKTGATLISPEGFFDVEDEDDVPIVKEADAEIVNERFPKPSSELTDSESWKHHFTDFNSIGRTLTLPELYDANGDVRPFPFTFFLSFLPPYSVRDKLSLFLCGIISHFLIFKKVPGSELYVVIKLTIQLYAHYFQSSSYFFFCF